jgi:putative oxidoreductase
VCSDRYGGWDTPVGFLTSKTIISYGRSLFISRILSERYQRVGNVPFSRRPGRPVRLASQDVSNFDDRTATTFRQPGDRRSSSRRTSSGTSGTGAHHLDDVERPDELQRSTAPDALHKARPGDLPGLDEDRYAGEDFYPEEDPHPSVPEVLTQSIDRRAANLFDEEEKVSSGWHGGADLGLFLVRLVLGGIFIAHGSQKLFGAFGGPGIDGFARMLANYGFRDARILSYVTGGTELAGGGLLVLGLFTPLAAAGLAGVMANVVLLKLHSGFFIPKGFEYELAMACVAAGVAFTGPGRAALDNGRYWYRHPIASGLICLVIAGGATAAIFFVLRPH